MPERRVRSGITRVGVLAVIGIIGLFVAILLPKVQDAREAARRNQCICNLKHLGISLHQYHDVNKKFPASSNQGNADGAASVWWPAPGSAAETGEIPWVGYTTEAGSLSATAGYSWIVMILPYMDEGKLYDTISEASGEFAVDAFTPYDVEGTRDGKGTGQKFCMPITTGGPTNAKHFAAVQLDEVACVSYAGRPTVAPSPYTGQPPGNPPAEYGFPGGSKRLGSPPQMAAITNYVALSATHFPCMQYGPEKLAATTDIPAGADGPNGMIVPGTGLNIRACSDGASKTVMVCETIEPATNCWYDGTTAWTTGLNPNTVLADPPNKANPNPWGAPIGFWYAPPGVSTALNVGPAPVTRNSYSPALAGYCATPRVISWGPSSNHAGSVVNHLTVDASVHPITTDIDPTLYMWLITIAGREPQPGAIDDGP